MGRHPFHVILLLVYRIFFIILTNSHTIPIFFGWLSGNSLQMWTVKAAVLPHKPHPSWGTDELCILRGEKKKKKNYRNWLQKQIWTSFCDSILQSWRVATNWAESGEVRERRMKESHKRPEMPSHSMAKLYETLKANSVQVCMMLVLCFIISLQGTGSFAK